MEDNMKLWIARDKDGGLFAFMKKPERKEDEGLFADGGRFCGIYDYDNLFSNITWDNSPVAFISVSENVPEDSKENPHTAIKAFDRSGFGDNLMALIDDLNAIGCKIEFECRGKRIWIEWRSR